MSKVIETILTVRPATPEVERAVAKDLSAEDEKDVDLEKMSVEYKKKDK